MLSTGYYDRNEVEGIPMKFISVRGFRRFDLTEILVYGSQTANNQLLIWVSKAASVPATLGHFIPLLILLSLNLPEKS